MSYSLNSLKGCIYIYVEDCIGTVLGLAKGDTSSLDYISHSF